MTYFFIRETKDPSLEQIDLLYRESGVVGLNKYRQEMLEKNEMSVLHDFVNHSSCENLQVNV
jgi:SP family sugar:H+ symporter-like MFS transporter